MRLCFYMAFVLDVKYTFCYKQLNFFWSGLWLLTLENHPRSKVAYEVANKLRGYSKVLKRSHAYLWVTENLFTQSEYSISLSWHLSFCCVFVFILLMKAFEYRNHFCFVLILFFWLLFSDSINRSHCNALQ